MADFDYMLFQCEVGVEDESQDPNFGKECNLVSTTVTDDGKQSEGRERREESGFSFVLVKFELIAAHP